jgi:hypothetical protein
MFCVPFVSQPSQPFSVAGQAFHYALLRQKPLVVLAVAITLIYCRR